jgi:flagellar hook-associated protein 2
MPLINFSGIASGIDTEGLISATSAARRATQVDPKNDEISELEDTNAAYEELNTKLSTLQSIARNFSTINGGIVAKSGRSSDETVATASASTSATNATYNIDVDVLARNATLSLASTATYSSADSVISATINNGAGAALRTVSFDIGTGSFLDEVDIEITNTTTLTQFVNQFNEATSKASASVVNVGTATSPNYRILIVSAKTGLDEGTITVDVGNEIDVTNSAFNTNTLAQAVNAEFTMTGIAGTIYRQSNIVTDLVDGVTFNFNSLGITAISVGTDKTATIAAVKDYVEAFNDIVTFIAENNLITRQEDGEDVDNTFGPLSKSRVDENVLTNLRSSISASALTGDTLLYKIFASIGLTTNDKDGSIDLDEDELDTALDEEPDSVNSLFTNLGDAIGLTGGTIDQFIRFNGLIDVVTTSNDERVTRLNDDIARAEALIAQNEQNMRARFARLEAQMGKMQQQQSSLSSILAGI